MSIICNPYFKPGQLTILMDVGAGSSGKGKIASYLCENADNFQFLCNTFHPQAGHWVKLDDGRSFFYQTLNSFAYNHERYEKMYIAPGAMIELSALRREIEESGVPREKIGISPITPILDERLDRGFEQGLLGFDGAPLVASDADFGTSRTGSTAHGVGSCNARRLLRRSSMQFAKDIPELADMICDVPREIMSRMDHGQAGLLEIAQGFQLSLMHPYHAPYTTSRNVTVAQGLSDLFIAPAYAGHLIGNVRTYPIRINSNKYIANDDGRHLTWAEVEAKVPHSVYEGDSGKWYVDQEELTWAEVTRRAKSPEAIMEMTSVTKLPRRVATFSPENVLEFMRHNTTGRGFSLSVNFANYVDHNMSGVREIEGLTEEFLNWCGMYLRHFNRHVRFIGTGANTEDTIHLPNIG